MVLAVFAEGYNTAWMMQVRSAGRRRVGARHLSYPVAQGLAEGHSAVGARMQRELYSCRPANPQHPNCTLSTTTPAPGAR